ncbi:MAG: hypothetical protein SGJ23_02325 [Alphaproteobacteria bacterium]|nr:hypothetical protein [Alphaproteobacteria bacterium]
MWRRSHKPSEEFELDTSAMFDSLRKSLTLSTNSCFEKRRDQHTGLRGDFEAALSEASQRNSDDKASVWTFSPVGFSPDGQEAMFLVETYCGMLCGGGHFVLMRRENRKWREVAFSQAWIS